MYPALTVISPQRGKINPKNIDALLKQDYPGVCEVIFVTTKDDASLPELQKYSSRHKNVRMVIAEDVVELATTKGIHRCQKNNNVLTAIQAASQETEIYAIVDIIPVAFICDRHYVILATVAVTSLICNKKPDTHYALYIIITG